MDSPTAASDLSLEASASGSPQRREADRVDLKQQSATWGEMGALLRDDKQRTPFGPSSQWPPSLRTAVGICMNSREPSWLCWGPELAVVYNDALRPLLGAKHPQSLGARASDVWREVWASVGPLLQAVLERGEATRSEALLLSLERNGRPDEGSFTFSYSPIHDETGAVGGVYCTANEITEAAQSDRVSSEQAVRFSETFVGVLGHELRNPLSAITTAANLLEMRAETDKIKKPVARILSSADRMDHMISQLLDFTRIRLGRGIHLSCQRADLYELSRAVMDEVAPLHKMAIRLESGGDVVGLWDGERLQQMLATLVGNACQHGSVGSEIVIHIDGAAPETVRLEVRNDGVVPSELLPFLFEPLRQNGDHAEKRDGSSGLGLGLYISKQIVVAHGGRLWVQSSAEQGTRLVAELPRWGRLDVAGAEVRERS